MNNVFVTLIPTAIGIAISPAPIIELILVLFSRRRVANSIAFIVTLLAMTVLVLTLGGLGGQAADGGTSEPSALVGWVLTALGVLLLVLGVKNWRNRADTSEPEIFAKISELGPLAVAFLAFGAVALNPKNAVLLLAAGQSVGTSDNPLLVGLGFTLVATLPYTLAVGYALLGGAAATARLDRMRAWLIQRNRLIMGVVCGLLGLVLVIKGLGAVL